MQNLTPEQKTDIITRTLGALLDIRAQDGNAILSSVIEHKGAPGDSDAAFVALVSKIATLAN